MMIEDIFGIIIVAVTAIVFLLAINWSWIVDRRHKWKYSTRRGARVCTICGETQTYDGHPECEGYWKSSFEEYKYRVNLDVQRDNAEAADKAKVLEYLKRGET